MDIYDKPVSFDHRVNRRHLRLQQSYSDVYCFVAASRQTFTALVCLGSHLLVQGQILALVLKV